MKSLFTLIILITSIQFSNFYGQKDFKVVFLIDQVYDKGKLNTLLESMTALNFIGEEYVQFKMISNAENTIKLNHNYDDGKDERDCEVIGMPGVRCDPCNRLAEEKKKGKSVVFAVTSDSDNGVCNMGLDDYSAISQDEDLSKLIKNEKKKAKKGKVPYTVIIWIPSNENVSFDLTADNSSSKVDFGTIVNLFAKTTSKDRVPVIIKVNNDLIPECKETGFTKFNRDETLSFPIEITESTTVSLKGKGCDNEKTLTFEVNENCNEIRDVEHDVTYNSKVKGPLGKKVPATIALDGIECTEIELVDGKLYLIVLNKQCGVREYKAELEDIETHKQFSFILRKSIDQSSIHLYTEDQKDKMVYVLNHNDLKAKGVFDERTVSDPTKTEAKYKMRIVPTEAVKANLNLNGKESNWVTVKFQKCN